MTKKKNLLHHINDSWVITISSTGAMDAWLVVEQGCSKIEGLILIGAMDACLAMGHTLRVATCPYWLATFFPMDLCTFHMDRLAY